MPDSYTALASLLDDLTSSPLDLDMTEAALCVMAEQCASECMNLALDVHMLPCVRVLMETLVREYGVEPPGVKDDQQAVLRCMDGLWWRRVLRRMHSRTREHAAIRLGFVSTQKGKYCSDEAAHSRVAQNRRNAQGMKATRMQNVETGQEFGLDELAEKTVSNPTIRKGELMLRMDGVDDIAQALGHIGLFVTLTAPSAYHAVLEKSGKPNPKYNGASPRDTQEYLSKKVWTLTRSKNGRDGIAPYGFRVAEPHHDGCTHWHMLVFMPPAHVEIFKRNMKRYALRQDGDEYGAQERRVTFEEMDPAKGGAAAYLAKYVGKNICQKKILEDKNGKTIITKEMRVDAWAGVWGIRQFQPIGQPPVTVYREMRRMQWEAVEGASEHVRAAWLACNRVELIDEETGKIAGVKRCDFAEYIKAQGGINLGRDYRIAIAAELRCVEGRYGLQERDCPIGVEDRASAPTPPYVGPSLFVGPLKPCTYESVRYTWKRVQASDRVGRSWSPVNNCTPWPLRPKAENTWHHGLMPGELVAEFDDEWFRTDEYQKIFVPPEVVAGEMLAEEVAARETKENTVWTRLATVEEINERIRNRQRRGRAA